MKIRRSFRTLGTFSAILLASANWFFCIAQSASTVTSISILTTTAVAGTPIKATSTVSTAGTPIHHGLILFCDAAAAYCEDSAILGRAQLTAGGTASTYLNLGVGTHSVKAVFTGAPHGTPALGGSSSGSKSVLIRADGRIPSLTFLGLGGDPGASTLSGTVAVQATAPVSGTLSFTDTTSGEVPLGTVVLGGIPTSVRFASAPTIDVSDANDSDVAAAAAGDFNHDGIADLAVADFENESITIYIGKGDGTYTVGAVLYPTTPGSYPDVLPYTIAVADLNGDGNLDLMIGGQSSDNYVVVYLGKGDGTFTEKSTSVAGSGDFYFAIGDYNGDGIPDFAVANAEDGTYTIGLGKGDGSFTTTTSTLTGAEPERLYAADFNGDGILDLAIATDNSSSGIQILLGKGDGTFIPGPTALPGVGAQDVISADFNGDGVADLAVVTNTPDDVIDILLGKGNGTFTVGSVLSGPYEYSRIFTADMNGDGIADIIVDAPFVFGSEPSSAVSVLLGNGDGTFTPDASSDLDSQTTVQNNLLGVADLNGDGIPDLLKIDAYENLLDILLGERTVTATVGNVSIPGADLQNVVASYSGDPTYLPSQSAGFNTGVITATPSVYPTSGSYGSPLTITLADATPGAVITYSLEQMFATPGNPIVYTGPFTIIPGANDYTSMNLTVRATTPGYITSAATYDTYVLAAPSVTVLHLTAPSIQAGNSVTLAAYVTSNGKAFHDGFVRFCNADAAHCEDSALLGTAIVGAGGWAELRLRLGVGVYRIRADFEGISGTGQYNAGHEPVPVTASSSATLMLTVRGKSATSTEQATATAGSGVYNFTSRVVVSGQAAISGTLSFLDSVNGAKAVSLGALNLNPSSTVIRLGKPIVSKTGSSPAALATADFNGDGLPDLVTANLGDNTLSILLGNGNGTFRTGPTISVSGAPTLVAVGDLNADHILDLVVAFGEGLSLEVLLGNKDGTFTPTANEVFTPAGPEAMLLADVNSDGILDIVDAETYNNTVTIFLGSGDGNFTQNLSIPFPAPPASPVIADFNGDGLPDLATSNTDGSVSILLGPLYQLPPSQDNYPYAFATYTVSPLLYPGGYGPLVAGDFNHDGLPDIAVAANAGGSGVAGIDIYLGNGDGTFVLKANLPGSNVWGLNVADFNGDGVSDLAVTEQAPNIETVVFLGKGDGTFPHTNNPVASEFNRSSIVADFNGDGVPDLAAIDNTTNTVGVFPASEVTTGALHDVSLATPGTHTITASYSGSANLAASVGPPLTVVVP